jgi:hypothetical protein
MFIVFRVDDFDVSPLQDETRKRSRAVSDEADGDVSGRARKAFVSMDHIHSIYRSYVL